MPDHEWLINLNLKAPALQAWSMNEDGTPAVQPQAEADQQQRSWLADKSLGPPKASAAYTAEELSKMGFVGVYRRKTDPTEGA